MLSRLGNTECMKECEKTVEQLSHRICVAVLCVSAAAAALFSSDHTGGGENAKV